MSIKVRNLCKRIGNKNIINNVSINFLPGEVNVIIGPNGAGKTTLLRLLALLDTPTSGEIFYNGMSSKMMRFSDQLSIRRKIGFVFQVPGVLEGTVYDNLLYGIKIRKIKVEEEIIKSIATKVGLVDKLFYPAKLLSGGEKQRLQFARVIILQPEVYFLDEPTNNLDPISTKIVEGIITELQKTKKTVILTTHNLYYARHLGKKIIFLKNGEVIQEGTAEEIFTKPISIDIAEFSLSENIIYGEIISSDKEKYFLTGRLKINVVTNLSSGRAVAIIRPEDILISKTVLTSSARNCFRGEITFVEDIGIVVSITVNCEGVNFISVITKQSFLMMNLSVGDEVYVTFKSTSVHIIPLMER